MASVTDRVLMRLVWVLVFLAAVAMGSWAINALVPVGVVRVVSPLDKCADAWALARTSHDSVTVALECGAQ